jgi:ABC-type multidrug transport system fused ATPase/permease subunit
MATNQLHILNRCDHIILLEGGAVRAQGSYAELQQDQGIAQYLQMRAEASVDEVAREMSSSSDSVDDEKSAMERDARKGKEGKIDTDSRSTSSKNQTKQQAEKDKERQGETLATGRISSSVYLQYVRSLGWHSVVVWSIGLGFTYACTVGGDWWLTIWIDSANGACLNTQADEICSENDNIYRIIYIAFCLLFLAGAVATSILLVRMGTRSGKTLHHDVFTKVLAAPLSWHEENPSGRVTSRFSAELLRVDIYINQFVDANSGMIYQLIATLCVIMIAIPPIIPVVATSGVLYVLQCILVDRGQRDFKRATNSALAPVMSNLSETLAGRVTVKAMGCEPFFVSRHNARVNHFTRMDICSQSVLNFGNLAAGYVSFPVTTGCAIMAVGWGNSFDPEQLGLALSYCFLIPYFASFIAQMVNTLLMMFTALERLVELKLIPQEAARTTPADDALPLDWPAKGEIVFDHAVLFYRPELPPALKDLHVTIPGGAHCGIVGRTGAGKSSIMALLFRLCEVSSGSILIDGHPIASLGLRRLRTAINMIPQVGLWRL